MTPPPPPQTPLHRRRRSLVLLALFVAATLIFTYARLSDLSVAYIFPKPHQQNKHHDSAADTPMSYGETARPPFRDLTHHASLPKKHIPSSTNHKRLIVVGDVHGMLTSLEALLDKLGFDGKRDHLVLAGDMINKGPDSPGVVDLAMKLGASAVRGNHEDRVLLAKRNMKHRHIADSDGVGGDGDDSTRDDLEEDIASRGDRADRSTARSLSHKQLDWLAALPVILDVGPIATLNHVVVVHAGLVPGLALKKQDPWAVMNMRSLVYPREELRRSEAQHALEKARTGGQQHAGAVHVSDSEIEIEAGKRRKPTDRDVAIPSDGHEGDAWTKAWNALQKSLPEEERTTVIFGHDSKRGLNVDKYTFGLDSGCIKGNRLSAVVIEGTAKGVKHKIVHVKCEAPKKERS